MRSACTSFLFLWWPSRVKNWCLRRAGHKIASSARIGICLVQRVGTVHMAPDSRIGHLNVIRDVRSLSLGEGAVIGQWNWITSARPLMREGSDHGFLDMGKHAALTSRHYVDCSGSVSIGEFATVAGVRSTIFTHGIDWRANRQSTQPVVIGAYSLIGSNCAICPGAVLPARSVVGMGAVVAGATGEESSLVVSPRATVVRRGLDGLYFHRPEGYVE